MANEHFGDADEEIQDEAEGFEGEEYEDEDEDEEYEGEEYYEEGDEEEYDEDEDEEYDEGFEGEDESFEDVDEADTGEGVDDIPGGAVPAGFDPIRITKLTELEGKQRKKRLRERFALSEALKQRRDKFVRYVLPALVIVLGVAVVALVWHRIESKRLLVEIHEAKREELEARDKILWMQEFRSPKGSDAGLSMEELQAWSLIRRGNLAQAREIIEKLAVERPDAPEVILLLGALDLEAVPDSTRDRAIDVLTEDPGNARALDLLSAVYRIHRIRSLNSEDEIRSREREVADYRSFLEKNPDTYPVLLRSGFQRIAIYSLDPTRNEELDTAIEELKRAVDLIEEEDEKSDNLARARHHLGRAYRHKADHLKSEGASEEASRSLEMALSEFERAFAQDGEDVASIGQVILIHRGMGRRKEGMDAAKGALPMVQGKVARAQLLAMIGGLHLDNGDQVAAAEAFQESLLVDPNQPAALLYTVKIKQGLGEKEVAATMLERALRRVPDFLEGQVLLAEARLALGRTGDAIAAFEAALTIPPESAVLVDTAPSLIEARSRRYFAAASALAWLYIDEEGDPAKARIAYNVARLHREQDAGLTATLGWIQHAEGDYEGAFETLSALAEKGDDSPQSRYYLALTLLKLDRQEEALREIEWALDGGVAFRGREDAEARMIEMWRRNAEARRAAQDGGAN